MKGILVLLTLSVFVVLTNCKKEEAGKDLVGEETLISDIDS